MVRRLLRALGNPVRGMHQAAYLLAASALASQILALLRDRLFAGEFGVGTTLDIYYAAFRIPDFLFATIASLLSLYAILPILSREEGSGRAVALIERLLLCFFVAMGAVSLALFFALPRLAPYVAPGFSPHELDELIALTRILLLQPILLGASNILAAATQLARRFLLYAISPILYNLGIIAGISFLYPQFGLAGLGYGVVFGALLHFFVQVPAFLRSAEGVPGAQLPRGSVREVLLLSFPRTLALAAGQVTLWGLVALASTLTAGSVSIFTFSWNLQAVPLTIIGVSYSVAAFPTLAQLFAKGHRDDFILQITTALRHISFWALPALILVIVLRAQIVRVILGTGAFDWDATRLTAAALAVFVLSLLAQSVTLLLTRAYYAAGKTLKPLLFAGISVAVSLLSGVIFLQIFSDSATVRYFVESLLRISDIEGTEVLMLALGYALGSMAQALCMTVSFVHDFRVRIRGVLATAFESGAAAVIGGATAYAALALVGEVVDIDTFWGIFAQGFAGGVTGILVTAFVLWGLRSEELMETIRTLRRPAPEAGVAVEPSELSS